VLLYLRIIKADVKKIIGLKKSRKQPIVECRNSKIWLEDDAGYCKILLHENHQLNIQCTKSRGGIKIFDIKHKYAPTILSRGFSIPLQSNR
jgi:hypothetical protein